MRLRDSSTFIISLVLLLSFFIASYAKLNNLLIPGLWWDCVWWGLAFVLILFFCKALWPLLESENDITDRPQPTEDEKAKIKTDYKDVHLAHFDHAHQEVTRYRDLPWKIGLLTWGIYYALIWAKSDAFATSSRTKLSEETFFIFLFGSAIASSIFLLFCEVSANRNRVHRREIAETLELHKRWRPTEKGERLTRPGFWFSELVFLSTVWIPPLLMLFYRQS